MKLKLQATFRDKIAAVLRRLAYQIGTSKIQFDKIDKKIHFDVWTPPKDKS